MKRFQLLFVATLLVCNSYAQPYNPEAVNKKAIQFYNQAYERAQDGNDANAIGLLLQAIKTDANYVDAYLALGGIYGKLKNYKTSIGYFEKAFALDSVYTLQDKYAYSINLAGLGEFEKALSAINDLLTKSPPKNPSTLKNYEKRKAAYEFGVSFQQNNPYKNYVFAPQNLGDKVNTAESEYFPSLTIDGKQLYFTRKIDNRNEDFFYSKDMAGSWSNAKPMEGNVNTNQNEGAMIISQDGEWVVFTGCYRPGGFGGCDIYISYKTENGWTEAMNLGSTINTDQWESQPCLSPDKRDLYFTSRRMGGYGGSDIYVSHLLPNGKWSAPENLGPTVNTMADEQCPFIHADNQTLYFTSSFWPGYGDDDLFYVRKQADNSWGKPVNLGYPINTIDREGTLFIKADGKTAYYASDRFDSKGGLDIYSFELREDIRPFRTLWVKGLVTDKKSSSGIPAAIELTDLSTNQLISKVQTNDTGYYLITLPVGKEYAFTVNQKGYLFYSDNFSISNESIDSVFEKNIALQPIEANASIVLKNIFFDNNSFELKPTSLAELDQLVLLLQENSTLKIEISGHTDTIGKPGDNVLLSMNRAKAVVNYLVEKNISLKRMVPVGYGETKPIADNKTEEGRALNRRTEMKIISK